MPLARIMKAGRWFTEHPGPGPILRAYFKLEAPPRGAEARPAETYSTEEELRAFAAMFGMRPDPNPPAIVS